MTTDTQEGTAVPVRRIDLLQDWWHQQGRYSRSLSPEARRALAGWEGITDEHVTLLATAVREENTVERVLRGAMRGFHRGGVCWQIVDHLRNGPMTSSELAVRIHSTASNAGLALRRLEQRGIVREAGTEVDWFDGEPISGTRPNMWELNPDIGEGT